MLWMSCIAEHLVKGELIPKQVAQVLSRGGAEVVKVERGEYFGKQPLLCPLSSLRKKHIVATLFCTESCYK